MLQRADHFHPVPAQAAGRGAFGRLVSSLRRRWTLVRLAERASAGWVVGLIGAAVLLLLGADWKVAMLLPFCAAGIALAIPGRSVTSAAAADRLDRAFGTKEVFGSAARLLGTEDGGWLEASADQAAAGRSLRQVRVARRGRWWWGGVGLLSMAVAAVGLLMSREEGNGARSSSSRDFASRGELLSPDSDRPPVGGKVPDAAPRADREAGTSTDGVRGSEAAAPGSAAAVNRSNDPAEGAGEAGAGAGASQAPVATRSGPDRARELPQTGQAPGGAVITGSGRTEPQPATGQARAGGSPGARPAPGEPGDPTSPAGAGRGTSPDRRVPAEYRELVRRYFSGGD